MSGATHSERPLLASDLIGCLNDWPMVILVDDAPRTVSSEARFLWTTFTRFEPASDIYAESKLHKNQVVRNGSIIIDARMKGTNPDELFCDDATAKKVTADWKKYFPDSNVDMVVEMGDGDWIE